MSKFLSLVLSFVLSIISVAACAAWLNAWCTAVADTESNILRVIVPVVSIILTILVLVGSFAGETAKEKVVGLAMQIAGTAYFGPLLWIVFVWSTGSFADTQPHKMLACFGLVVGFVFFIPVMAGILGIDTEEK